MKRGDPVLVRGKVWQVSPCTETVIIQTESGSLVPVDMDQLELQS